MTFVNRVRLSWLVVIVALFLRADCFSIHKGPKLLTKIALSTSSLEDVVFRHKSLALEDFDLIYQSLKIYRNIYESPYIPIKFTVPHDSDWPLNLHGFRLGRRLESISQDDLFSSKFPHEYEKLKEVGYDRIGDILLDDWTTVTMALRHYKNIFGDLRVASSFTVPAGDSLWPKVLWGWKLGNRVTAIRSAGTFVKGIPARKQELENLGFEWGTRDQKVAGSKISSSHDADHLLFKRFCEAFQLLQKAGKPMLGSFSTLSNVPSNLADFPFDRIYLDLIEKGRFVKVLQNVQSLMDYGFQWPLQVDVDGNEVAVSDILNSLLHFRERFETYTISQQFTIPSTGDWPASCRGLNLFNLVEKAKQSAAAKGQLGIMATFDSFPIDWSDSLKSRRAIAELDDDVLVPVVGETSFEAPSSLSLRQSEKYVESEELDDLARTKQRVPLHPRSQYPLDMTYMFENMRYREWSAHQVIKEKTKRMNAKSADRFKAYFDWKDSPHKVSHYLAFQIPPDQKEKVEALGYRFIEFGTFTWEKFISALRVYKDLHGHVNVPLDYSILTANEDYDAYESLDVDGMELGYFMESLRQGDIDGYEDAERRPILDSLGFQWGDMENYLTFRFIPFITALRIQQQVDDLRMGGPPLEFVVGENFPYFPFWLKGVPLGEWYQRVKMQRQVLEKYYPDRMDMLDSLDFKWWWPFPESFVPIVQKYKDSGVKNIK